MYKYLTLLILITTFLLLPTKIKAEQYFFQEEFNNERTQNTLDQDKWLVYPNTTTSFMTLKESGGFLQLNQQLNTKQFPLAVSKQPVIPSGDFSTEVKFQYTNITFWGTGFGFSETPFQNGQTFDPSLFSIVMWQDATGARMEIGYDGTSIFSSPLNTTNHLFKITRINKRYMLYLDNQLVFTSPETNEKIKYAWIGNPGLSPTTIPQWTTLKLDYIRSQSTTPEPFLRLPWDYESQDLTFNEAAMAMSAYFDHEYPLLSSIPGEPENFKIDTLSFENKRNITNILYSSHDGYDYARDSKAYINKPILASYKGTASYVSNCSACGNAIVIDHHNGYQTRYYHLQKEGLITPIDGTPIEVTKGQQIALIGYSGNVLPSGPDGAHLHFMVVQDKNNDGNFNDNIPDGITDPYGWQSTEPDPWENYTFTLNNLLKKGNKSFYLWDKQLSNLDTTLTSNGGVFNTERYKVEFPQNFTAQNLQLKMESEPQTSTPGDLISIGSTIKITLSDFTGNLKEQFTNFYKLTIQSRPNDFISIDPTTLSIYSSRDRINWVKETTLFNSDTNTATTDLNHMTYFALMAKRKDLIAPETTLQITGEKGNENWYRSDVSITLNASDNPNGLGVEYTFFKINDGEWQIYQTPIKLTDEKLYQISYYSIDKDGNKETIKQSTISIDKTIPEAKLIVNQSTKDLVISGIDQNSTQVNIINSNDLRNYIITDIAGNKIILTVQELDRIKRDNFSIKKIQYNNQTPTTPQFNQFRYGFLTKNSSSILENQFFTLNNLKENIDILYTTTNNISRIIILKNGKLTTKSESGLKLLQVTTNKGTLIYSY